MVAIIAFTTKMFFNPHTSTKKVAPIVLKKILNPSMIMNLVPCPEIAPSLLINVQLRPNTNATIAPAMPPHAIAI